MPRPDAESPDAESPHAETPDETPDDRALLARLAAPPQLPGDISRFSSNTLFGEPGIYPDGPPMVPAVGDAPDDASARRLLGALGDSPLGRYDDPTLRDLVPSPLARAALSALVGTIGEALLDGFAAGAGPVRELRVGAPASPGRVVGPGPGDDVGLRVVNARYRGEHPVLVAPSLVHDLLWSGPGAGQHEEATLHALCALTHVQLVARHPFVAELRTELARRQHSLAITLLNSRHPGSPDIAIVAPDGPGTIPGGAAGMQTPDFWCIPFVGGPPQAAEAPALLAHVLDRVASADAPPLPAPLRYDDALGTWLSATALRGALTVDDQFRAATALGLLR